VHLREPGGEHKEDFASGSRAAIAGGFGFVIDMPNNDPPTVSPERLAEKISLADAKAVCGIGFHYGTDGKNTATFAEVATNPRVFGLKIYLNPTTGDLCLRDPSLLDEVFAAWDYDKPVLVHAEGEQLLLALELARRHGRRLHVCHISQAAEVDAVRRARGAGQLVTAGVCPHHLYLIDADVETLHAYARMKPPLGSEGDRRALWDGLEDRTIDIVETDHAPHTIEEKLSDNPPFGVPGLETALPLMLRAVNDGRLDLPDVVRLMHDKPREIFGTPEPPESWVEVDPEQPYRIGHAGYQTRCSWSPFDGFRAYGPVATVVLGGREVFQGGTFFEG